MQRFCYAAMILVLAASSAFAERYSVTITRVNDHFYKVDGTDYILEMPYCYEYSYSDDVVLELSLFMGKVSGTAYFVEENYLGENEIQSEETIRQMFVKMDMPTDYLYMDAYDEVHDDGYILMPLSKLP